LRALGVGAWHGCQTPGAKAKPGADPRVDCKPMRLGLLTRA